MVRPAILVAEPEPEQALSVRKLVLETAKFNVLTAHSTVEAEELVQLFPNISAAVLVQDHTLDCEEVAQLLRRKLNSLPIVSVVPQPTQRCKGADHHVSSHEPEELVSLMRELLGDPRRIDGIKKPGADPEPKTRRRA